ncbi:hypothetical protein CR205_02695 [Alteribacter lacisalsi]|jgi:hypothetical protein|uniref:DUF624 domain-containing protein n=1 Tax=Alteribacter lacisalsi TaxID=2045244 RepID=A0A2W0HKB0_9BACI|nr:DUF624 domain-containing protein [Alteribacter lacisalsi]PYZ97522.1 hypothetical protein CR205_02695 [Alteribacter lacisalsi]
MRHAMTVFYRSIFDTYQNLGTVLWATILWWLSILPVITLGPATAGLLYVIRQKRLGKSVRPRDYWYAFRLYLKPGVLLTLLYLLVSVPGAVYFFLLLQWGTFLTYFGAMIVLYILILWHLLLLYTMPLMVEQKLHSPALLLKRALRLVTENYLFTVNIVLYMVILTIICTVISIFIVIWAGWMAMTAYNSMMYLMSKYDEDQYAFDPEVKWGRIWRTWK